ncbi:NADPH-dependent 2,4-dienoyl-CoA reductase/sulfur reductase-like enzyme/nitrite reductase/ring-hydroxylating ferredoxin subunit [Silvibacterium bohemicum]|uniref:NADPH-dependent 2,4-dienoyl-CoA reductase/sulfur reductase-like enzyme/nitrite reductase/ring-hydroxylating ferredoxin subunit n=1 Tax=Silvibacterium bohemicum TaxID=1577686 RepID=A0A841K2F6_9BACT|nr:FAD-dependent oxidoreductase [Silvibacterium bohemicum]MBB6144434.1 NADPH-dependent 2,4-dienoyl-CoA reductase/sulfur reductase-like enzyme/nitrite reductase/ring-hydroxylating ferredoxin subunit [Silvibacterium bohemicum]
MPAEFTTDFGRGVPLENILEGQPVAGNMGGQEIVVVKNGSNLFAVDGLCSHYHSPLKNGIVVNDTIRCPLHHACFDLKTGEAIAAPALDTLKCWRTEVVGDLVFVREVLKAPVLSRTLPQVPKSVVIIGGGAAGLAAAEMLRREGYGGPLTMLSADDDAPYDRPNLSKDYLAGATPPEWMPLRVPDYYATHKIDLVLQTRVTSIDREQKRLQLENGKFHPYDALLIATGARPVPLTIEGVDPANIYYLRSFHDARRLAAATATAKRVVVVGASFIGLETAASLRTRGVDVHVVAPDSEPLAKVLGTEVGRFIRELHESHGVHFHLGRLLSRADGRVITLSDNSQIDDVDLIVAGIGVRPSLELATQAGLQVDRGVIVDPYLATNDPNIYAAGDIARWPDPHSGQSIRVEHFAVAQRQGQTAAKNILGMKVPFDAAPFFWSQHYDVTVNYVGHAEPYDEIVIDGSLSGRNCEIRFSANGVLRAIATIGRDRENLLAELQFERRREVGASRT